MTRPCPTCGTVNQPTAKFCKVCGTALAGSTGAVTPPPPPPSKTTAPVTPPSPPTAPVTAPTSQVACPHCGKPNRSAARRCAFCGKPLQAAATAPTPPPAQASARPPAPPPPITALRPPPKKGASGVSLVLLACLVLALCGSLSGIFVYESIQTPTIDIAQLTPSATFTPPPSPTPVALPTHTPTATPNPPNPVVAMKITSDGRFGFRTLVGDPNNPKDDNKPLTYRQERTTLVPDGGTNNTRLWVDSERKTPLFGGKDGQFIQAPRLGSNDSEMSAVWQYEKIVVTQTVQVVLSAFTHRLDTFRIGYVVENRDTVSHTVGIRLMIDTLIGDNDGVPFNVPGKGFVNFPLDLRGNDIPNLAQVYEVGANEPGVTIQMTLKGSDATAPDRFVIAPWCKSDATWDFLAEVGGLANRTLRQCGDQGKGAIENKPDSAVGIFFDPKPLAPGETREWVTFYGLGEVKKETVASALSLVKPADRVRVGEEFWIVAMVQNPRADQKVKLTLPTTLQLTQNPPEQSLQGGAAYAQVAWRVRAISPGDNQMIKVELAPENQSESVVLSVMLPPTPTFTPPKPCTPSITNPCR